MPRAFAKSIRVPSLLVAALIAAWIAPARASDPMVSPVSVCLLDTLSSSLHEISPALNEVLQFVRSLDPRLVSMERTPGWQDIEDLKAAIEKLKSAKADLAAKGRLKEALDWAAGAEEALKTDPKLGAIVSEIPKATLSQTYQPGEYALKRLYIKLLYSLDRELPRDDRIRIRHLPLDPRPRQLLEKARKLVADQEKRFAGYFATSGFTDDAHLRAAIGAAGGIFKQVLDMLDNGQAELAMNRPEGARWWVPKVGFENQRTTGSSRGTLAPDFRDQVEAKMTGMKYSEYKKYDNELKPEYGYLRPAPGTGLRQSTESAHYGDDTYVFKPDRVRDRLTWTAGDSFGPAGTEIGGDEENPVPKSWPGFFVPWKYRSLLVPEVEFNVVHSGVGFQTGYSSPVSIVPSLPGMPKRPVAPKPSSTIPPMPPAPMEPPLPRPPPFKASEAASYKDSDAYKKWLDDVAKAKATDAYRKYEAELAAYHESDAYKAWSAAMAAYSSTPEYKAYGEALDAYMKAWTAFTASDTYKAYMEELRKAGREARAAYNTRFKGTPLEPFRDDSGSFGYIELQFFGPLILDDVAIFEFRKTPPSGEFLAELRRRGIRVRDGRKDPAVDWKGESDSVSP